MKKQKKVYHAVRYLGPVISARREIPYELILYSRLILDEICFNWNKATLEDAINRSIEYGDKERFFELSEAYIDFIRE